MSTEEERTYLLETVQSLNRELVVISPDHVIVAANDYAKGKYGRDMVGKHCHAVYYGREKPCSSCPVQGQAREELFEHTEAEQMEGTEYGAVCYPLESENCPGCVAKVDFDPPKMDRLRKRLQQSNAFLHNLLVSSVDAVIAADMRGNILIFNDVAAEVLGYSREEAMARLDIRDIYPEDGAREVMGMLRSEDKGGRGKLKSYRVEVLSKEGERIPISLNASVIYEGGEEVATIGYFYDMREDLKMEKELEETRLELFQSAKMAALGKLAAGVAHQINNPLAGINLFAQLLLEEHELGDEALEDVQRILEDTNRCRETVRELLEFAKQSSYEAKPQDINKALSRTVFLLEKHAIFHNIEIRKEFEEGLPYPECDLQQLSHVFMNIIINAAEAMEGNGVLRVATQSLPGDWIRVTIADTGPGIDPQVLPYIFDPFFSTKETAKNGQEKGGSGTGLGLIVAYRIVRNHRGRLHVANHEEGGAVFTIDLPLVQHGKGE
ncbi:MAG: PAS domain S-box protein [Desulfohalobiaceae bacterium]|nr:PAS domain S-box protein [Desulfohalobiaceae bacterium]